MLACANYSMAKRARSLIKRKKHTVFLFCPHFVKYTCFYFPSTNL